MAELFVAYPVNRSRDARMLRAGDRAELVDVRAWALSKQLMSDGLIERVQLRILGADEADVDALVKEGLWEPQGDAWRIPGFTEVNMTREVIVKRRKLAADRKARYLENLENQKNAEGTRSGTREERVPEENSVENHKDDQRERERESEAKGTRSGTRDDDVVNAANEHFPGISRPDIAPKIDIARARGYSDDQIIEAIASCEWPSELLNRLEDDSPSRAPADPTRAGPWCPIHDRRIGANGCIDCAAEEFEAVG